MSNPSRVEALFFAALEKPGAAERAAYLDSACGGDAELRSQVEKLLKAHPRVGDFLQGPVVEQLVATPRQSMIGETVGHYRITAKLGAGGMGEVFLAEDTRLERKAAIKFLPAEMAADLDRRQRFLHQARAASAINHPHVCVVYDVGDADDGWALI